MQQVIRIVDAGQAAAALRKVGARLRSRERDGSQVWEAPTATVRVTPLGSGKVRFMVVKGRCDC